MFTKIKMFFSAQGLTITVLLFIILGGAYYLERNERISLEVYVGSLTSENNALSNEVILMREQSQLLSKSNESIRIAVAALSKDFQSVSVDLKEELKVSVRERTEVSTDTPVTHRENPNEIDSVWAAYHLALGITTL